MDIKIKHLNLRHRAGPCRLRSEITQQCTDILLGDAGTGAPGGDVVATVTRKGGTPVRDLTGQVFGELTVLERAENSKAGKARWLCRCSCSRTKTVLGEQLVKGETKTCGDRKKHPCTPAKDVVGEQIGEITIIGELEPHVCPSGDKQRRVLCRCPLGHEFEYRLAALRSERRSKLPCKKCRDAEREMRAREDQRSLIGKTFGRLTVISIAPDYVIPSTGYPVQMYNCRCKCKNKTVTARRSLESGKSKSCGCLKRELASERALDDLTGQKFGLLTVLRRVDDKVTSGGNRKVTYECFCDGCGTVTRVSGSELRNGQKSCGCMTYEFVAQAKIKDLSGQRFGRLVAVRMTGEQNSRGDVLWQCICDCERTCVVSSHALLSGNTGSCGCLQAGKSKLEVYVRQYFDGTKPKSFDWYESQVRFDDLRGVSGGKLSYDFGLYSADGNLECLIECQGMQHYKPVDRFGGEDKLEVQRVHDALKREYAANHGVRLVEAPYTLRTYDKVVAYLRDAGIA